MRSIPRCGSGITPAERASATENDVGEQALPQVEVDAVYGVHDDLVNASVFLADEFWIKEDFWSSESLRP